jgi:SnoaL-like domain
MHPDALTALATTARVRAVTPSVVSIFDEYTRRYSERDVEGVTNLCLWPFLAIRNGKTIHLPDRDAVRDHFANAIIAYRVTKGDLTWTPIEIEARELGEHSVFATLHWNAVDADGQVLRDTWTSYQLLATPDGWRFLSYTNHF